MGKEMNDLQRLLATQDFKNKEDLESFLNKHVVNQQIPSFEPIALSDQEKAEDLIFQAYEASDTKEADQLVKQALALDKNCVLAYQFLGEHAKFYDEAIEFFQQGIKIAEKEFGKKFFKENEGHFWLIYETRPYMQCLFGFADCSLVLGRKAKAITTWEKMIKLNPNDNQGIRYNLLTYLASTGKHDKYKKYFSLFQEEDSCQLLLIHAFELFLINGDSSMATDSLKQAFRSNKFLKTALLSELPKSLPSSYALDSKEEADVIAFHFMHAMYSHLDFVDWIKSF